MTQTINARFDGKSIVPDKPLEFPPGQRLRIQIETVESDAYPLGQLANLATDMGMTDLANRHQEIGQPEVKEPLDG